jgi:DNA primase
MDITEKWFNYLHSERKLSTEVIRDAELRIYKNRLRIPIFDAARHVIFSKYRREPWEKEGPKYVYEKGGVASLYGIHFHDLSTELVYCEGEMDVLALRTIGYNAVSTTGGAMTFKEEWKDHLPEQHKVICYDNDDTGIKGAVKVVQILKQCTYTWIPPVHGKDVGDLLNKYGPEEAKRIFKEPNRMIHLNIPDAVTARRQYVKELSERAKAMDNCVGKVFLFELVSALTPARRHNPKRTYEPTQDFTQAVERAKSYPIEYLIPLIRNKAKCPFHEEKTGSFHVYKDNHAFCHGSCNRAYDSIDVYKHLHNCSFKEAVEQLNRL